MEKPPFSSMEEAWIDLCANLSDPVFLQLFGKEARSFFYAGATSALALITAQRITQLKKDLWQFTQEELRR